MVKITQVDPAAQVADEPVAQVETSPAAPVADAPKNITIELSRGGGTAVFRLPNTIDMMQAETQVGALRSEDFPIDFYRELAKSCCEQWGNQSEMPPPDRIRLTDDDRVVLAFVQHFSEAGAKSADIDQYSGLVTGGSKKTGWDAIEIELTDGSTILLDEPTQEDARKRDKSRYSIEGFVIMASSLCQAWNGEPLSLAEYRIKMNRFSVEDYLRVTRAITFFRL